MEPYARATWAFVFSSRWPGKLYGYGYYALKSDRTQRELLNAAAEAATEEHWADKFPNAKEDVEWLLNKVNALSAS